MPEFVDFLFTFGEQHHAEDFYVSGFRQRNHLANPPYNGPPNGDERKRLEICYSLKSVEPSDTDEWSIRHCAVHHMFDLTEIRASWILVKGDDLMKRRIESVTGNTSSHGASKYQNMDQAFEASFKTHLIFCDWSTEHWRWYINWLEEKFRIMTEMVFSAPINNVNFEMRSRTNTPMTEEKSKTSIFSRTKTQLTDKWSLNPTVMHQVSSPRTYTNPETGISQPLPPDEDENDDEFDLPKKTPEPNDNNSDNENREFSFGKLRKTHEITKKANEAMLVLKQNLLVLCQLKDYYMTISKRKAFPADIAENCKDAIDDFGLRIEGLKNDMQTQILRLETLLNLVEDRKTLVRSIVLLKYSVWLTKHQLHSILDYQNTRANKNSTHSMVIMTEDMNDIARKTKIETVSMKVITLTLMSTDIFQQDYKGRRESNPYMRLNPVQIYLALSLPLTVVTLLFWAAFHFWEMRREKQKEQHHKDANAQA
ncbi:MAG: hypothetical protein Q9225_004304 [Loekoesia sp. 1 TL-2023]